MYVKTRQEAIDQVKSGAVTAAVVIPADITDRLQQLINIPGSAPPPTVEVFYNADPLKRQGVESRINSRLADANIALGKQIIALATSDLDVLLDGGTLSLGPIDLNSSACATPRRFSPPRRPGRRIPGCARRSTRCWCSPSAAPPG